MSSAATAPSRVVKAAAVRVAPIVHLTGDADIHAGAAEAERQRMLDEAYRAGVADGRAQAEDAAHTTTAGLAANLTRLAADVRAAACEQVATDAAGIAGTALEIARWVLGRELAADTTAVITRIEAAMTELAPAASVEVHVAPPVVGAVEEWAGNAVEVHADPALMPGEARLVAGACQADLTFAEAFRRAAAALGIDPEQAHG